MLHYFVYDMRKLIHSIFNLAILHITDLMCLKAAYSSCHVWYYDRIDYKVIFIIIISYILKLTIVFLLNALIKQMWNVFRIVSIQIFCTNIKKIPFNFIITVFVHISGTRNVDRGSYASLQFFSSSTANGYRFLDFILCRFLELISWIFFKYSIFC